MGIKIDEVCLLFACVQVGVFVFLKTCDFPLKQIYPYSILQSMPFSHKLDEKGNLLAISC